VIKKLRNQPYAPKWEQEERERKAPLRAYTTLRASPMLSQLLPLFCPLWYQAILIERSRSAWEFLLNFIFNSLTTPQDPSCSHISPNSSNTLHTSVHIDRRCASRSLSFQYTVTDLLNALLGKGLVNTFQCATMETVSQWTNVIARCQAAVSMPMNSLGSNHVTCLLCGLCGAYITRTFCMTLTKV
jgi:hypothetical protein